MLDYIKGTTGLATACPVYDELAWPSRPDGGRDQSCFGDLVIWNDPMYTAMVWERTKKGKEDGANWLVDARVGQSE